MESINHIKKLISGKSNTLSNYHSDSLFDNSDHSNSSDRHTYTVEVSNNPDYILDQTWEFDAITGNSFLPYTGMSNITDLTDITTNKAVNNQTLYTRPSIPNSLNPQTRPSTSTGTSSRVNDSRVSYNYNLIKSKRDQSNGTRTEQRDASNSRRSCLLPNGSDVHRNTDVMSRNGSRTSAESLTPKAKLQRRKSYDPKQSIDPRIKNQTSDQTINKTMTSSATSTKYSSPNKDLNNNINSRKSIGTTSFAAKKPASKRSTSAHNYNQSPEQITSRTPTPRNSSVNRRADSSTINNRNSEIQPCTYPDHLVEELAVKLDTMKKFVILLKDMIKDEYAQQNSTCDSGDDVFAEEELNQIYNEIGHYKPLYKAFKDIRTLEGTVQEMYGMLSPDNDEVFSTYANLMKSNINYKEAKNFENLKVKVFEKLLTKPDSKTNSKRPPKFPQNF